MGYLWYILVFVAAMVLSLVTTPVVIRLARHWKLYDARNARKVHTAAIPRVGGIAIVVSTLAVALPVVFLGGRFDPPFAELQTKLLVLLSAATGLFVVGLVDDVRDLRATVKLVFQIAAAAVVCAFDIRIEGIMLFGVDFGFLSWPVTLLWIVGLTNAVNLIDGLDGLSAGICAATCGVIVMFALFNGQAAMALLVLPLLGSLVGFLVFNFNPAKVFMGDGGSMFLGFVLATVSIVCATKVATVMGLLLPALALGLPIFDMLLAVVRRVLERRSPFSADRQHVHHRLLDMGLQHHHVVIVMYLVTLLAVGAGLAMMALRGSGGEIVIFVVALLALLSLFRVAGTLSFRKTWQQVQANLQRSRDVRRDRKSFEALRNRFRAAWTFEQWWKAVRRMARRMGFTAVTIEFAEDAAEPMTYQRPAGETPLMHLKVPIVADDATVTCVTIDVPVADDLETIGRRISLFGRLLDEHPVPPQTKGEEPKPHE